MDSHSQLNKLIYWIDASSTPTDAGPLIEWAQEMVSKIERGDMSIGIISVEQARLIPNALRKALGLGAAEAGILLADWLVRTPIGQSDVPEAEKVLLESIALGRDDASVQLMTYRWFYRRHACTSHEALQAFSLLEKWCASNSSDGKALYLLALVTCHGFGTSTNPQESAILLHRAASLGNVDAMFELFIYFANGIGVDKDDSKAIEYLNKAAAAGQVRAMYNLGAFYATGRYVQADQKLAVDWYTRAANAGHAKSAETLATMYENGLGVERNETLAQRFRSMLE